MWKRLACLVIICVGSSCADNSPTELDYKLMSDEITAKIILTAKPRFVYALEPSPPKMEEFLSKGTWLIVAPAATSATDQIQVQQAYAAVKLLNQSGLKINLGIRPFCNMSEFDKWLPTFKRHEGASPAWVILQNGRVTSCWGGPFEVRDDIPRGDDVRIRVLEELSR